ncbi:hypothetical protein IC582_011191 [Cucumis melo]
MHHFVCKKRQSHDSTHLTPVISINCKHHILAISSEDVKHNITRTRAKLNTLSMENLASKLGIGHDNEVLGTKLQEEYGTKSLAQGSKYAMVEVIANLEPIAKDGKGERAGRKLGGEGHGRDDIGKERNKEDSYSKSKWRHGEYELRNKRNKKH